MSCDFVCGWFAGCCGLVVGHPFDTLKVRQQALKQTGILDTLREATRNGWSTVWRGMAFPLLAAGSINSALFGVYGLSLSKLTKDGEKPGYLEIFLAGCIGGAGQLVIAVPVDLVKVRLQAQTVSPNPSSPTNYTSILRKMGLGAPIQCLQGIYTQEGLTGCYRGFLVQGVRDIKASGIYFLTYQYLVDKLSNNSSGSLSPMNSFCAGGLAGVLSWQAIVYLDVVKSRWQADNPRKPQYTNTWQCVRQSYRQEGVRVFTRGFTLITLRAFPLNGATFVAYEYCMKACQRISY